MSISTKFSRLVSDKKHLDLTTDCVEFVNTVEYLKLNTQHKGVIKSALNKTSKVFLEQLLNVVMPTGHRYEIKKHCDNENCCNPLHMTFELREVKSKGISDAQKALWADEEHRADRVKKITEKHQSKENRLVHSEVYKQMHANNYDILLQDNTILSNLNRDDAKQYILIGASLINRKIIYITNDTLKENKKFSIMGKKGKFSVYEHLKNGWDIGYSSQYKTSSTMK